MTFRQPIPFKRVLPRFEAFSHEVNEGALLEAIRDDYGWCAYTESEVIAFLFGEQNRAELVVSRQIPPGWSTGLNHGVAMLLALYLANIARQQVTFGPGGGKPGQLACCGHFQPAAKSRRWVASGGRGCGAVNGGR